ncbi:MAG: tol-pal system protein YbgF, partial [Nitrospirales bacterium]|nr:tol-pal system protein YbgF [Nitrospirales bacterium]
MRDMNSRLREPAVASAGGVVICGLVSLLLSGCLAQQAELKDVERNLGTKITKLDQRDKELQQTVKQAKVDIDRLVSETRARLSQEISALREEELPALRGGLDKDSHQMATLRSRLEDLEHQLTKRAAAIEKSQGDQAAAAKTDRDRLHDDVIKLTGRMDAMNGTVASVTKKLGEKLDEQDKGFATYETKAQQLESHNRALTEQMAQYKQALADYKKALTTLGEKLVQEEQRTMELSNKIAGRTDQLVSKVDTDTKATTTYLNDVNKSVGSVARAVETMNAQLVPRIEEQDRRLDDLTKLIQSMDPQHATTSQAVMQPRSAREQVPTKMSEDSSQASQPAVQEQAAPPPVVAHASRETSPHTGQARESYDRYITTFKQGNLDAAMYGFSQFLTEYPTSDLAANAQYWLGECYYGKKDYARAIEAFDRVKVGYPSSEKVPSALLKKGFAHLALKDRNRASSVWRQVVDGYPN